MFVIPKRVYGIRAITAFLKYCFGAIIERYIKHISCSKIEPIVSEPGSIVIEHLKMKEINRNTAVFRLMCSYSSENIEKNQANSVDSIRFTK